MFLIVEVVSYFSILLNSYKMKCWNTELYIIYYVYNLGVGKYLMQWYF